MLLNPPEFQRPTSAFELAQPETNQYADPSVTANPRSIPPETLGRVWLIMETRSVITIPIAVDYPDFQNTSKTSLSSILIEP